ncbi:hypothetical protein G6F68_013201 [Rhizopus microsporus]|nr:hypothetical protein G6F68_013201 [Rhizopus microsporus]
MARNPAETSIRLAMPTRCTSAPVMIGPRKAPMVPAAPIDPEKERHAAARHTAVEQYVETQQGDDEEPIHRRQKYPPRKATDQPAIHRLQHQHDHEHAGEQELQDEILQRDAMAGEPGDQHRREHRFQVGRGGHGLTHRAQHVVAAEQAEEVQERPPQRRRLTQCRRQPTQRPLALHRAHAAPGAVKRVR